MRRVDVLLELLIILAILGILALIVLQNLGIIR